MEDSSCAGLFFLSWAQRGRQLPYDRDRQFQADKAFGGVQVVLSAFVNDAQEAFLGCLLVWQDLIDFPRLQILRVTRANTEDESRMRAGFAHD